MNKIAMGVLAGLLAGCACDRCVSNETTCEDPVIGNWGAKLPYDSMYAGSFVFSRGADGSAKAFGGAIDANEFVPGPIYLQGDHSDADYRNMILRPVVK